MSHDARVRQLVQQYVVYEVPWQLHEVAIEYNIFLVGAATPAAGHLFDLDCAVLKAVLSSQESESSWQQPLGLFFEGPYASFGSGVLNALV